jgi:hypothetical protein
MPSRQNKVIAMQVAAEALHHLVFLTQTLDCFVCYAACTSQSHPHHQWLPGLSHRLIGHAQHAQHALQHPYTHLAHHGRTIAWCKTLLLHLTSTPNRYQHQSKNQDSCATSEPITACCDWIRPCRSRLQHTTDRQATASCKQPKSIRGYACRGINRCTTSFGCTACPGKLYPPSRA